MARNMLLCLQFRVCVPPPDANLVVKFDNKWMTRVIDISLASAKGPLGIEEKPKVDR